MEINSRSVLYNIDLSDYRAHIFTISMTINGACTKQEVSMPTWTPGSYMVREFSQHILSIKALEDGQAIIVQKSNKNTYTVSNKGAIVSIIYQVYAFDSSIRAACLDSTQGFFNGTALLLRPHGIKNAGYIISVAKPKDEDFESFLVATAMKSADVDTLGFGTYIARSYEEMVDCPFQISEMKLVKFVANNTPHEIALVGDVRPFDEKRLIKDLRKLCETEISLFGQAAPFSRYLFIARFEEGGHGGLEHMNSAVLLSSPYALPKAKMTEPDSHYRNFLSLCAHEYFHAWNVKRLKPHNFMELNLDHECYTTMLWIFEGLTSYYDDLLVRRAGLIAVTSYLDALSKNYTRLLRNEGRNWQSVAESSFDAWIKFYRPNENSQNFFVSYYQKGAIIGLYLDLSIRLATHDEVSLDDVMRLAFVRYGNNGGMTEEQFFDLLRDVGKADADFVREKYIYGTEELPLKELLNEFGIDLILSPDETYLDDKTRMGAFLGLKLRFDESHRGVISFVEYGGPAMRAGLSPYDEIMACNGIRLDSSNIAELLSTVAVNDPLVITYARKKLLGQATVIPGPLSVKNCKMAVRSGIDKEQAARLEKWLGPERNASLPNDNDV